MSKLKKTAMNLLVKQLQPQHYTELYKQFQALDTNQNGLVDATDFMHQVNKLGLSFTEKEIQKQLKQIDVFGDGQLNYTEFLSATLQVQAVLSDEILWELF